MTLSRALSTVVVSGLVAACSGDPGSSIPGRAHTTTTSPPDPTEPTAPGANGDTTTPVAGSVTLTVSVEGTGQVVSQPAGIACPGQCTARFLAGTTVTLVSAPAEGWRLDAWRGACAGGAAAASCSVNRSR